MNEQVQAVMAELDEHRDRYAAFCRSLKDNELQSPVPQSTWLVRDFIAHLATIDRPVMQMFQGIRDGRGSDARGEGGVRWDVDDWNEAQVQERRSRTVEDLLAEAADVRSELRDVMAGFTAEDLDYVMKFGGDAKRPPGEVKLGAYLRGWCKHDPMHAVDMLRGIPERLTPDLEQWFDDPVIQGYQAIMNRDA